MAADGRVLTGFSYPVVGKIGPDGTYSAGMVLARGVAVNLQVETVANKSFYADNGAAESANGRFKSGKAGLTVDGLHPEAEKFVMGLGEPKPITYGSEQTVNVTGYGDNQKAPYVGIGYIARYVSDDVDIFVPTILRKAKFKPFNFQAKTQEEEIDYQTQELEAELFREDKDHEWKWIAEDQATEEEARAVLDGILKVTHPGAAAAASTTVGE